MSLESELRVRLSYTFLGIMDLVSFERPSRHSSPVKVGPTWFGSKQNVFWDILYFIYSLIKMCSGYKVTWKYCVKTCGFKSFTCSSVCPAEDEPCLSLMLVQFYAEYETILSLNGILNWPLLFSNTMTIPGSGQSIDHRPAVPLLKVCQCYNLLLQTEPNNKNKWIMWSLTL